MNTVEVTIDPGETGIPDPERLIEFTRRVLEQLSIDQWEVSLLFCSNERMRQLNREFRGRDESTDVLSFPQFDSTPRSAEAEGDDSAAEFAVVPEGEDGVVYAGDIVISCDHARTNAQEFSVNLEEELKRLIVHGVLHLHGLDHSDNDPNQPMLQKQEALMKTLSGERLF